MKKYEIKITPPARVILAKSFNEWEWIPHERQPLTLFLTVIENRELFQALNDDFWDNHVKPFFVENGKKKLNVFRNSNHPRIINEPIEPYGLLTSGIWKSSKGVEPSYNTKQMLSLRNAEYDILEYQTAIYNRADMLVDEKKISGDFALDTIKNALLMFISSDVKNFTKYFKKINLNDSIFSLPIRRIAKINDGTHIVSDEYGYHSIIKETNDNIKNDDIIKDYSNFEEAYGISSYLSVYGSLHALGMANSFFTFPEVFEEEVSLVSDELKIKDFFKECVADGFLEYAIKNKEIKLKIPAAIKNKMDFLIWKKIATNTKITEKSLLALLRSFGFNPYLQAQHAYHLKGLNFLLNENENLHERKYFLKIFEYKVDITNLSDGSDNIHPFWFEKSIKDSLYWMDAGKLHQAIPNETNLPAPFLLAYRDLKWIDENLDFEMSVENKEIFIKYDDFMNKHLELNNNDKSYLYGSEAY